MIRLSQNSRGLASYIPSFPSGPSSSEFPLHRLLHDSQPTAVGVRAYSASRKGKERSWDDIEPALHSRKARFPHTSVRLWLPISYTSTRHFHSTPQRNAIPLIPVTIGLMKGTSVLTVVTAFSRILISFFPIGALSTFRMLRLVRWQDSALIEPTASPDAHEVWKMWCEGERGVKLSAEDAKQLLGRDLRQDGAILHEDGKVAWGIPMPPGKWRSHRSDTNFVDPEEVQYSRFRGDVVKQKIWVIRKTRYYLPELPPASIRSYGEMLPRERGEVDALRRYWTSMHMFKDGLKRSRKILMGLLLAPFVLIFAVYLAGLERVPLTGRWRIILLTPEEEDAISTSLAGQNWYRSVINLLTTPEHPAPPVVPLEDWRWRWVQTTLRRLEAAAIAEAKEGLRLQQYTSGEERVPIPAAQYPLKPRPRMSWMLHTALPGGDTTAGNDHLTLGPPYSVMLMQKDEKNAFSYGFGGKGAGGVVIFTGLLDDIMKEEPVFPAPIPVQTTSLFSGLAGMFSSSTSPPRRPSNSPTEEQTLHLASVLAHEMGHLLLSHHLETLSQQQVLWPSILGLAVDLTRAFIWPITWILGPTVNDALANVGRTSTAEISGRYGQIGFQYKHEYEADLAGLRILALAGFDPKAALSHFSQSVTDLREIQPLDTDRGKETWTGQLFKLWSTATHPSAEQRMVAMNAELDRWRGGAAQ